MITLASDFGTPYPAAMKGVLLRRTDARLVDVGHDFPRQDVRTAAFWLRETLPYFPPATHLVVVDPGVGTDRAAIAIRAGDHVLVGPDNGVLVPAARRLAGDEPIETYAVDERAIEPVVPAGESAPDPGAGPQSNTFHGRDVFAPAAAAVHEVDPDRLGSLAALGRTADRVDLTLPDATVEDGAVDGEVLVVDDFGNVVTSVPGDYLEGRDRVLANGEPVPVGDAFADVPVGRRLALVGSHGYVELDVNRGRGEAAFDLAVGDRIVLEPVP
ncbi:SAM-dependent chlorinase/fluorinase [Natronococcus sp. JC468]|uniref:SAM-dependent chlorinase/fluorinase n=1 Tax=Natronococcus sp. JC468 TaxID=1961921 RepID=UPI00143ABB6F|nr:SAM-dependent chlorinase/fluorinase [Natronococcus sp. JC468]NKE37954.1 SAM-dependent chlorinase/fluorinase [Natronococcus sp. JC468]